MSKLKIFTRSDDPNTTLGWAERIAYGFGNVGNAVVYGMVSLYLTYFYTDVMGLSASIIGTIFLLSRVFDGVTDLAMGRIVDRTHSKTGKARVWLLRLCVPYAISGILLFTVPEGSALLQYIYVIVSYNFANSILFTGVSVPYNSLLSLSTKNSNERGFLGIFPMFGSLILSVIVSSTNMSIVNSFASEKMGWIAASSTWAVVGLASHLICYFGTRERVTDEEKDPEQKDDVGFKDGLLSLFKNYYWIIFTLVALLNWMIAGMTQTSLIYYVEWVLQNDDLYGIIYNVQQVTQIVFLAVAAGAIVKLGKVNTFRIGMTIEVVGFILRCLCGTSVPLILAAGFLIGAGGGFASAVMTGIVADILDYGHWKTGIRVVGLGMSTASFAQKVGYGLASAIWGLLIGACGYDGTAATQTSMALFGINAGFTYVPMLFAVLMLLLMLRFPLDKQMAQVRADEAAAEAKA